jgi:hypothetical protein
MNGNIHRFDQPVPHITLMGATARAPRPSTIQAKWAPPNRGVAVLSSNPLRVAKSQFSQIAGVIVSLRRALAEAHPDAFTPDLATSLDTGHDPDQQDDYSKMSGKDIVRAQRGIRLSNDYKKRSIGGLGQLKGHRDPRRNDELVVAARSGAIIHAETGIHHPSGSHYRGGFSADRHNHGPCPKE